MANAEKKYTEADLRDAFRCGLQHGVEMYATTDAAERAIKSLNWIDCLFYQGFRNETLFRRSGFVITETILFAGPKLTFRKPRTKAVARG